MHLHPQEPEQIDISPPVITHGVALVDLIAVVEVELVQLVGQGANLADTWLVGSKVALESLVLRKTIHGRNQP